MSQEERTIFHKICRHFKTIYLCRFSSVFKAITYKSSCKRMQHVGTTLPNIVGIVLADVGFRVFKQSRHVGQCCFLRLIPRRVWVWYLPQTLWETNVVTFVRHYVWHLMNTDDGKPWKCIAIAIAFYHLENTPRHINKNRELKQWRWERQWERYKTIV